ncbi:MULTISPECIES: NAD(P)-dependent alcohol dehydrogenase [unclassified Lysobacter]|uniref:NAD(P)-dependent alcohol dehydrogenase n=1 Tax=unclassified Lysobacter TaxID=2635362 RepID=UPI001BEA8775|nr:MULTISPECIES: NAD(P)-dependent alcohol dehydrogenase [unclassified Lysobacter]MBT2750064.1 NAD(P)-dependent alcohol dehydrogenase [Lysobacter sp. ISL-50]MBT2775364.1 NAD(P)-dependent alcohol dehydrogenase [Lysobacter sp. ISL-54]MBT2783487.1 NAD(P)-dependent alcohol dehydrogenase [Lysobacter sp. ISL-52]
MKVTSAVAVNNSDALQIRTLELDPPGFNEVLVRIVAAGLCHTDIATRDKLIDVPMPVVLGHEGAGVVERVGPGVEHLQPGDHVVLSLASCGTCRKCASGLPVYCESHAALNWAACRTDGTTCLHDADNGIEVHSHFFGQSSFSNYATVNASSTIKVDPKAPLEYLGPFACGIMTGAGAVLNTLSPHPGTTLVVFGLGAVGLAAVMAARAAGCGHIVAVDIKEKRLALAKQVGATHALNPMTGDLTALLAELTQGRGADYAVEAAGNTGAMQSAIACLAENGQCVLTGVVKDHTTIPLDVMHVMRGRHIKGTIMGDAAPKAFIPQLIELFVQGRFPVDALVRFYPIEEINQAIEDSLSGETIKAVIQMHHPSAQE